MVCYRSLLSVLLDYAVLQGVTQKNAAKEAARQLRSDGIKKYLASLTPEQRTEWMEKVQTKEARQARGRTQKALWKLESFRNRVMPALQEAWDNPSPKRQELRRLMTGFRPPWAKSTAKAKPRGRPASKRAVFEQAAQMKASGALWSQIAKKLDPQGYSEEPKACKERIRSGVRGLRKKTPVGNSRDFSTL